MTANPISRRSFIALGTGVAVAALLPDARAAEPDDWVTALDASAAVAGIRRGDFTAERYVAALIGQADRWRDLDVFISRDDAGLLAAARALDARRRAGRPLGELAGIPLLVKDNIETAALPTTAGTPALRDYRPRRDAPALARLLAADAVLWGKANMHELAMGVTSDNATFGAVRNPYDPARIPGGSSGGTAAGIAARLTPVGLGTDTGGSGRIPASLCGVAGFRPSPGRYPAGGVVPTSHTRDTIAPMGRTVADVDLLDRVLAARPPVPVPSLAGVRLGLPKAYFWADAQPDVRAVADRAVRQLQDRGCTFVDVDLPGLAELLDGISPILVHEAVADLADYLRRNDVPTTVPQLVAAIKSPDVAATYRKFLSAGDVTAAYRKALDVYRPRLQAVYADCFRRHGIDAVCFPATPTTATAIGADAVTLDGVSTPLMAALFHDDNPASAAGLPALVVPAGLVAGGLPVGLEFDGPAGTDTRLLAIGVAVEQALGPMPAPRQPGR